jgi:heterodisulfide reductase subunit A
VVGGGVAGLETALAISKGGYSVTIVEKAKKLGGNSLHIKNTWQGNSVQSYLKKLISSAKKDKNINILTDTLVKDNRGFCGKFTTTLDNGGKEVQLSHGVAVLATGGEAIVPDEYLYGKNKSVLLWSELGRRLVETPSSLDQIGTAVFIQCVGSREPERPYCSNLCCTFAARSAVDLKRKNPDMDVYVLYREMRTFGQRESLYRDARKLGVVFIRYDLENKPTVESIDGENKVNVTVTDPILQKKIAITADLVSLQTAIAGPNNKELADIFKINLDNNGFFSESPEKMKPIDTTGEGIYMAGLASYPKDIRESISQAKAAAARAIEIMKQDTVQIGGRVAEVRPEKCAVCCTCVRTCPFNVPYIDSEKGAAFIDPGLCQGCGMCVAECPGKAIVMSTCSDQMLSEASLVLLKAS